MIWGSFSAFIRLALHASSCQASKWHPCAWGSEWGVQGSQLQLLASVRVVKSKENIFLLIRAATSGYNYGYSHGTAASFAACRKRGYRGVVVGWDVGCCEDEAWQQAAQAADLQKGLRWAS
jgi:hypothetical protein